MTVPIKWLKTELKTLQELLLQLKTANRIQQRVQQRQQIIDNATWLLTDSVLTSILKFAFYLTSLLNFSSFTLFVTSLLYSLELSQLQGFAGDLLFTGRSMKQIQVM